MSVDYLIKITKFKIDIVCKNINEMFKIVLGRSRNRSNRRQKVAKLLEEVVSEHDSRNRGGEHDQRRRHGDPFQQSQGAG